MKRAILAALAVLPFSILAIEINTTANDEFWDIPEWMPTKVKSKDTPGSSDFIRHAIATSNEANEIFLALSDSGKITTNSAMNLFSAFVHCGGINTNDLADLYNGFNLYGAMTTNQAFNFYTEMAREGVTTTNSLSILTNHFNSSAVFTTNQWGIGYFGDISKRDAGYLFGSLARKYPVTVTNAAALYACFDGYCQRVYYMSCGPVNYWDESEYGGLTPLDFRFPADFGSRTNVYVYGTNTQFDIIGFKTNMQALASNVDFQNMTVYRPSWPSGPVYVGSSCLEIGKNTLLDPYGLDGLYSWQSTIPNGRMVILRSLNSDPIYNQVQITNLWYDTFRTLGHGDPYFDELNYTNLTDKTYSEAILCTIGSNAWNVSSITNIPSSLDAVNLWMGSAAQALTFIDRTYDFISVHNPTNVSDTSYSCTRTATYQDSDYHVVAMESDGIGVLYEPVAISSNDWSVAAMTHSSNTYPDSYYSGLHFRDIIVDGGGSQKSFGTEAYPITLGGVIYQEIENVMILATHDEEETFEIYCGPTANGMAVYICSQTLGTRVIKSFSAPEIFSLQGFEIKCSVSKSYNVYKAGMPDMGIGEVRSTKFDNEAVRSQSFSILGGILVNTTNTTSAVHMGDDSSVCRYGQSSVIENPTKPVMSNAVVRFATTMDAVVASQRSLIGDYEDPESYAPINASELSSYGVVRRVAVGTTIPEDRWFGKFYHATGGSVYVTDFYHVVGGATNSATWGSAYSLLLTAETDVQPIYEITGSSSVKPAPSRRMVGDVQAVLMTDFNFDALENDL